MRWREQRQSRNVEDRRGTGGKGIAIGGGGLGMLVLVLVIYLCGGGDIGQLLNNLPSTTTQEEPQQPQNRPGTQTMMKTNNLLRSFWQARKTFGIRFYRNKQT